MSEICNRHRISITTLFKLRDRAFLACKAVLTGVKHSCSQSLEPVGSRGLPLTRVDLIFALLCLVTLAGCLPLLGPLKIRLDLGALFFKCLMSLFLFALMVLYVHRAPSIARIARVAFWAIVFTNVFVLPLYLGNRLDIPFRDAILASLDRCLGVEVPKIIRSLAAFPVLAAIFNHIYDSLVFLIALALILPAALGQTDKSDEFLLAIALGALATILALVFLPAVGPWIHYKEICANEAQVNCYRVFRALKSGEPVVCNLGRVDPLVTFPSWHTMFAVLSAVALTRVRVVRWLAAVWAAAIILSCVTTGWHYFVDLLGGLMFSLLTIIAARMIIRYLRPPSASASAQDY
jgi:membrane-associated phospholipid phosphatase